MKDTVIPNNVELTLSENSPLIISLSVCGEEKNIITLLPSLMNMVNMASEEIQSFVPPYSDISHEIKENFSVEHDLIIQTTKLKTDCSELGIVLSIAEYHMQNCSSAYSMSIKTYYFDNSNDLSIWDSSTLSLIGDDKK
jgi:hypothetical protein